jgi:hypothetical protein
MSFPHSNPFIESTIFLIELIKPSNINAPPESYIYIFLKFILNDKI